MFSRPGMNGNRDITYGMANSTAQYNHCMPCNSTQSIFQKCNTTQSICPKCNTNQLPCPKCNTTQSVCPKCNTTQYTCSICNITQDVCPHCNNTAPSILYHWNDTVNICNPCNNTRPILLEQSKHQPIISSNSSSNCNCHEFTCDHCTSDKRVNDCKVKEDDCCCKCCAKDKMIKANTIKVLKPGTNVFRHLMNITRHWREMKALRNNGMLGGYNPCLKLSTWMFDGLDWVSVAVWVISTVVLVYGGCLQWRIWPNSWVPSKSKFTPSCSIFLLCLTLSWTRFNNSYKANFSLKQ